MLQVAGLTKKYGDLVSVNAISFDVGEHEVIGLLGTNGAGKSTTIRMLTGYLSQTEGSISFMGTDLAEIDAKTRMNIGYLPEIPPLYTDFTVTEHLRVVCGFKRIPKAQVKGEIDRVCRLLNLEEVRTRLVKNLSKGYKQRVGFAAAIVGKPKLLVLDEPAVGLDPKQLVDLRNLIRDLSQEMSIILSSHMLSEITTVCTRIILMKRGNIVADGTPQQIRDTYATTRKIVLELAAVPQDFSDKIAQAFGENCTLAPQGQAGAAFTLTFTDQQDHREALFRLLVDMGAVVRSMHEPAMSLEEIFIDINKS